MPRFPFIAPLVFALILAPQLLVGLSSGWLAMLWVLHWGFVTSLEGSCDGGLCGLGLLGSLFAAPIVGLMATLLGSLSAWLVGRLLSAAPPRR